MWCHFANGSKFVRELLNSCCADGPSVVRRFMRERGRWQQTPITKKGLTTSLCKCLFFNNTIATWRWRSGCQRQIRALVTDARRPWRICHTRPIVSQQCRANRHLNNKNKNQHLAYLPQEPSTGPLAPSFRSASIWIISASTAHLCWCWALKAGGVEAGDVAALCLGAQQATGSGAKVCRRSQGGGVRDDGEEGAASVTVTDEGHARRLKHHLCRCHGRHV